MLWYYFVLAKMIEVAAEMQELSFYILFLFTNSNKLNVKLINNMIII